MIKDGAYIIDLGEYPDIGNHWILLYVLNNNVTYFDSFGVEHILKEITKFIERSTIVKIFLEYKHMIQYFCVGFIEFKILIFYFFI